MARMRPEIAENLRRRGGPASLLITAGPAGPENKTLEDVAKERGVDPVDAAITILRQREAGVASFHQTEADIAAFMKPPWVRLEEPRVGAKWFSTCRYLGSPCP